MCTKMLFPSCAAAVLFLCECTRAADRQFAAGNADYSKSNTVWIAFGEDETPWGLNHLSRQNDGRSVIEGVNGVPARKGTLRPERSAIYYYFALDPAFKSQDLRQVKIEVEYFDPSPGTMGLHYDSANGDSTGAKYTDANRTITLAGSRRWQKVVFTTQNDGGFYNRQNGQADFRLWAKTTSLYVARVSVTRAPLNENWTTDFSKSNHVSVVLGKETSTDGVRHLTDERDGQTVLSTLHGEPVRYLNRTPEGRPMGSFYFQISPSFKTNGLKNLRVEIEYWSRVATGFRLQYDAMTSGVRTAYRSVLAEGATVMRYPTGADYGKITNNGTWQTATFHLIDAVFHNSQKGMADFRIEVVPPEIYIRRVTLIRESDPR